MSAKDLNPIEILVRTVTEYKDRHLAAEID